MKFLILEYNYKIDPRLTHSSPLSAKTIGFRSKIKNYGQKSY